MLKRRLTSTKWCPWVSGSEKVPLSSTIAPNWRWLKTLSKTSNLNRVLILLSTSSLSPFNIITSPSSSAIKIKLLPYRKHSHHTRHQVIVLTIVYRKYFWRFIDTWWENYTHIHGAHHGDWIIHPFERYKSFTSHLIRTVHILFTPAFALFNADFTLNLDYLYLPIQICIRKKWNV